MKPSKPRKEDPQSPNALPPDPPEFVNTSGHGPAAVFPTQAHGLNWGAFFLNWIWGIGNNSYIALLTFVPFLNVIMPFILLFKGNEWAWRNKQWTTVAQFHKTQRTWAVVAILVVLLPVTLGGIFLGGMFFSVTTSLRNADITKHAISVVQHDPRAIEELGSPIRTAGWVTGHLDETNTVTDADLNIPVIGPKFVGTIRLKGKKKAGGTWQLSTFELDISGPQGVEQIPMKM